MLSFFNPLAAQETIEPAWTLLANATDTDNVTDLWVSPSGNSYVLGHITTLDEFPDMDGLMFMKVNGYGEEQWRKYIHAVDVNWGLFAGGVAGDGDGNVYIIYSEGYRYTDYTNSRIVVAKYDQAGEEVWSHYLTEEMDGRLESVVSREILYKDGYLYFAGNYTANLFANTSLDGLIYKVSAADGSVVAKVIYNGEYGGDDMLREVRVDDSGNMYAIGRSKGLNGPGGIFSNYDALTVKFDADGNKLWEHALNGTGNSEDNGINISVDGEGNSFSSSQVKQIGINQRLVVIEKLSPAGEVRWTHEFQGSSSGYNFKQPIEVLPNGNVVFVTSNEDGINTIVLNGENGTTIWADNYNRGTAGAANRQRDMLVDNEGNIYITGVSRDDTAFGAGYDMVTMKYNSEGGLLWLSNYNNGNYETMGDEGVVIRQDGAGNVYVAGWTQYADADDDFLIARYGDAALGTNDVAAVQLTLYPNPVVDVAYIAIPQGNAINSAVLTDLNGRIVKSWNESTLNTAHGEVALNLQGIEQSVYILTVESGGNATSFKIIKK